MKTVTEVLVGSRLHNLHREDSDYDWRGIHINPIKAILSPFKKTKNTSWIEGDVDSTSYELVDFCKQATHGNATILEVFFSNEIKVDSEIAKEMRDNWKMFIDTDKFVAASRGYAHNQYNKMRLFEPDERTPKFAVAYQRVLWQCWEFLRTDKFKCQIEEPYRSCLLDDKYNFTPDSVLMLGERFMMLQQKITEAYPNAKKRKPNFDWIEGFIYRSYMKYKKLEDK